MPRHVKGADMFIVRSGLGQITAAYLDEQFRERLRPDDDSTKID
jgi:hypothetical protein